MAAQRTKQMQKKQIIGRTDKCIRNKSISILISYIYREREIESEREGSFISRKPLAAKPHSFVLQIARTALGTI